VKKWFRWNKNPNSVKRSVSVGASGVTRILTVVGHWPTYISGGWAAASDVCGMVGRTRTFSWQNLDRWLGKKARWLGGARPCPTLVTPLVGAPYVLECVDDLHIDTLFFLFIFFTLGVFLSFTYAFPFFTYVHIWIFPCSSHVFFLSLLFFSSHMCHIWPLVFSSRISPSFCFFHLCSSLFARAINSADFFAINITIYHPIFRVSHLEQSDLQIGRHAHNMTGHSF
jgi:hypothetical protein